MYRKGLKRAFDILLLIIFLPFWLPVMLIGALLIAWDGHNPFYVQERVGQGGRIFRMWKLRTMVVDADAKLEAYLEANPKARAEWDMNQKSINDPRITAVGRVLRKTSIDELPQVLNVLRGDMSLVGPRPFMVSQKDLYHGTRYYELRPGITGLWQVSDRHLDQFASRVHYDNLYSDTLSLRTDVSVIFSTVGVLLRGTGYPAEMPKLADQSAGADAAAEIEAEDDAPSDDELALGADWLALSGEANRRAASLDETLDYVQRICRKVEGVHG